MKPQFHLPVSTYPDPSSFTIVDNAIDLARQNDADLVASIPQVRVPPVHQPFPTFIDVDTWREQAEGYSQDSGISLREHLADAVSKTGVQLESMDSRRLSRLCMNAFPKLPGATTFPSSRPRSSPASFPGRCCSEAAVHSCCFLPPASALVWTRSPLPGTAAPPQHVPFPAHASSSSARPRCRSSRSLTTRRSTRGTARS